MAQEARSSRVNDEAEVSQEDTPQLPDAFCLPDGSTLKFALPRDRGNPSRWFRTFDYDVLYTWRPSRKEQHIRLGLWNGGGTLFVIAADFDRPPEGFGSFDQLAEFLRFNHRNAIVSRSVSNKVKCFFLVRAENGMNQDTASETLHKILGPDLFPACDLSPAALSWTFITPAMARDLKQLSSLTPIEAAVGYDLEPVNTDVNKCITPPRPMRRNLETLSEELQQWVGRSDFRLELMRILTASRGLLSSVGMDLPTTYLSTECGCSAMQISRYLRELQKGGFLECVSRGYRVGFKAKTFRATGALRDALRVIFPKVQELPDLSTIIIEPGMWNEKIFQLSAFFANSPARFRLEAEKLRGIEEKDRRRKVEAAIRARQRYKAKAA